MNQFRIAIQYDEAFNHDAMELDHSICFIKLLVYIAFQLLLPGLHNGHGARPDRCIYTTVKFKLRAPARPGVFPVSMGWAMHYTYPQAYQGNSS